MEHLPWLMSISAIIAIFCNFVTQVIISRFTNKISVFVYSGVMVGLMVNIRMLYSFFTGDHLLFFFSYSFTSLLTYLSLSFCYWAFLNLNRTSLRIRMLRELFSYANQGLSKEKLLSLYRPHELLRVRLHRLEKAGKIVKNEENKWKTQHAKSRELFIIAHIFGGLRKLIIPGTS